MTTETTTLPRIDTLAHLRTFLQSRGFALEQNRLDTAFLPPDQRGQLEYATVIAYAGDSVEDNTLQVIHVPQRHLTKDLRKRWRKRLTEALRDGLVVCTQDWQVVKLYLLLQDDEAEELPEWTLQPQTLRPHEIQALQMLDIRAQDAFELGRVLLRAFRRAERQTLYDNQGLFSNYYLDQRLPDDHPQWGALAADMPALQTRVQPILHQVGAESLDDKATTQQVVRPLLQALGWQVKTAPNGAGVDLQLASDGTVAAVCNVVPWNVSLEDESTDAAQGSPDLRLIAALTEGGQTGPQWGILTNGLVWRLVSTLASSASGVYYQVDLRDLLRIGQPDDLRFFAVFFGAQGLLNRANQPGLVLKIYQDGQRSAKQVGEDLKKEIYAQVFVDLATALVEAMRRQGEDVETEGDDTRGLRLVYRATLILLYRLLFLLYAEARRLLPVVADAYYPHSLTFLLTLIALHRNGLMPVGQQRPLSAGSPWIWHHLRELFRAIATGKAEWGVPRYNGGLFADDASPAHALLARLDEVGADYLALGIDRLARDSAARGARDIHGALRLIDFMALDVRRLGSIYEGLLEFQLRRAQTDLELVDEKYVPYTPKATTKKRRSDKEKNIVKQGSLYLANTRQERKASGSYYTPDYIVRYIVEHAVGPVLVERAERFARVMDHLRTRRTELRRAGSSATVQHLRTEVERLERAASETLLDLKVLDPAMGSGHFLVTTVDFLSDQMITILEKYRDDNPIYPQLRRIRESIQASLREQGIADSFIRTDALLNRSLLRRMVMKRCVYGVDLNDMAVDLARLSLWLHSFTVGAPLSFLDHHLKHGNSLIGIWEIEKYIAPGSQRWNDFMRAMANMLTIARLTDSTFGELAESYALYDESQKLIQPTREQFNVDLAVHFADLGNIGQARRVAYTPPEQRVETFDDVTRNKFSQAQEVAREKKFFHWKLEFAEVFVDLDRQDWKEADAAGFDVVVGNPPYGLAEKEVSSYFIERYKALSNRDLFTAFIEVGLYYNRDDGLLGYIVPTSWQTGDGYQMLRSYILLHSTPLFVIGLPFDTFTDAFVDTGVYIFQKTVVHEGSLARTFTFPKEYIGGSPAHRSGAVVHCMKMMRGETLCSAPSATVTRLSKMALFITGNPNIFVRVVGANSWQTRRIGAFPMQRKP